MPIKIFNKVTGESGEDIACKFLIKNGYKIIKRNYKSQVGEIDIIAKIKDILVFVEVKIRTSDYFGLPRDAVNIYKQNKIRKVALAYLKYKGKLETSCRFDVIEILNGEVTHLINCF